MSIKYSKIYEYSRAKEAIKEIEDKCGSKPVSYQTILTKIDFLEKCAKMIFKMLNDNQYLKDSMFGEARKKKFIRLTSLCQIDYKLFIIHQLRKSKFEMEKKWKQKYSDDDEVTLQFKSAEKIIQMVEQESEGKSNNLVDNILTLPFVKDKYNPIDKLCYYRINQIMKEKDQPQSKK